MEFFPHRISLYLNRMFAVILTASVLLGSSWLLAQGPTPQFGRKPPSNKGPRAVGLIQLSPKGGKGRLIPIAIMMDGKFFDAGSYKAAPVPMALDFDTVYEGFRAGVSQGLFTVTQPGQLNHVWIAEGTWLPAGEKAPEKSKKYSTPVIEDNDAPPVLHRRSEGAADSGSDSKNKNDKDKDNKDKDKAQAQQKPEGASVPPAAAPSNNPPSATDTGKAPAAGATAKAAASDEPIDDPNRPRLRRGKPDPNSHREPFTTFDDLTDAAQGAGTGGKTKSSATANGVAASSVLPPIALIPAISDAGGPDPRPYTYDVKPAEEAIYRNRMFDLAAAQLRAQGAMPSDSTAEPKPAAHGKTAGKSAGKAPTPVFDDVSLRIFDLSNANEPVLVLSAKTHPPAGANESFEPQEFTLIARTNLQGELKKIFLSQTDARHLDVAPRMELIDAVDADGDGRGELLFRRTSDGGSAYAIYRVSADQLRPLFEGTP
jgi:hypothetical protein